MLRYTQKRPTMPIPFFGYVGDNPEDSAPVVDHLPAVSIWPRRRSPWCTFVGFRLLRYTAWATRLFWLTTACVSTRAS